MLLEDIALPLEHTPRDVQFSTPPLPAPPLPLPPSPDIFMLSHLPSSASAHAMHNEAVFPQQVGDPRTAMSNERGVFNLNMLILENQKEPLISLAAIEECARRAHQVLTLHTTSSGHAYLHLVGSTGSGFIPLSRSGGFLAMNASASSKPGQLLLNSDGPLRLLIDTGAQVSVCGPRKDLNLKGLQLAKNMTVRAASDSSIPVLMTGTLSLSLRTFTSLDNPMLSQPSWIDAKSPSKHPAYQILQVSDGNAEGTSLLHTHPSAVSSTSFTLATELNADKASPSPAPYKQCPVPSHPSASQHGSPTSPPFSLLFATASISACNRVTELTDLLHIRPCDADVTLGIVFELSRAMVAIDDDEPLLDVRKVYCSVADALENVGPSEEDVWNHLVLSSSLARNRMCAANAFQRHDLNLLVFGLLHFLRAKMRPDSAFFTPPKQIRDPPRTQSSSNDQFIHVRSYGPSTLKLCTSSPPPTMSPDDFSDMPILESDSESDSDPPWPKRSPNNDPLHSSSPFFMLVPFIPLDQLPVPQPGQRGAPPDLPRRPSRRLQRFLQRRHDPAKHHPPQAHSLASSRNVSTPSRHGEHAAATSSKPASGKGTTSSSTDRRRYRIPSVFFAGHGGNPTLFFPASGCFTTGSSSPDMHGDTMPLQTTLQDCVMNRGGVISYTQTENIQAKPLR